jgi:VWFA-related protein
MLQTKNFKTTLLGAALLLSLPPVLRAADAQTEIEATRGQYQDLVEVSEVLLDVLVTDRQGNVVVGLSPDDFVVEEKGKELPLTGASFYSNRFQLSGEKRAGVAKPAPGEVLADRHFIFFFHDQRRLDDPGSRIVRQQLDAGRQARRWIEQEMLQGDWVAVVGYDVKLKVYSDFSRDRQELADAVERASRGKDPGTEWASRRPQVAEGVPTLLRDLPTGKDLSKASEHMYDALSLVAEATHGIVGRKNLMLFTIGFGDIVSGFSRPDSRYWPKLRESLNDNNVAVYPIDLVPTEFQHTQEDFLSDLASETGGYYHRHFVNFITPMKEIADEVNGYYLLSYLAPHEQGDRGYQKVKVKTRNPELKVRARQGYRFGG